MEPAEAVLQFLEGVGRGSEAEFYLRLFRSRPRESFAAIVVDSDTLRGNAEGVAVDLRLLATLSLTPVLVLGFYAPSRVDDDARRLRRLLAEMNVDSEPVSVAAPTAALVAATGRGVVPIVRLCASDEDARLVELAALLSSLGTRKLIFLRGEGGFTRRGQPVSVVNLSQDYAELMALPELRAAQRTLLARTRRLVLELVSHELLVTVTSPISLLHELFTVKGAGTLLRKGARVERHEGLDGVDRQRLAALLEDSFDKPLPPAVLDRPYRHVYVEAGYRGAALVATTPLGSYLSKFAVTREAQGEGVGRDLWQAMTADHATLFWRARQGNPIRPWYDRQCDGRARVGDFIVYWLRLQPAKIPAVIEHALAQPIDFT